MAIHNRGRVQLLRMPALTSDARSTVRVSAQCAAVIGTTTLAARFFRGALDRIFLGEWGEIPALSQQLYSPRIALIWFLFVLAWVASHVPTHEPRNFTTAAGV